jgi:hypothetical protein
VHDRSKEFLNREYDGKSRRTGHGYHLRGAKRRRTSGGGYRNLRSPNEYYDRGDVRGSWYCDAYKIPCHLKDVRQEPISERAKDLLRDLLKREAFWRDVEQKGVPPGFAGEAHFPELKRRRVQEIHKELVDAGSPWEWFSRRVMEDIRAGRIAGGLATRRCQIADQFFLHLAGGNEAVYRSLQAKAFGGHGLGRVATSYEGLSDLECEILNYTVVNLILGGSLKWEE